MLVIKYSSFSVVLTCTLKIHFQDFGSPGELAKYLLYLRKEIATNGKIPICRVKQWSCGMEQPEMFQFSEKPVTAMVRQTLSLRGQKAGLDQRIKNFWHWGTAMLISGFLKTLRQFFESVSHKSH